ncbi:FAD-binding protein [Streptomyces sp. ME03-5709C]|nr:FAD-binding protein [Streptomyces sp. ME03-5709C]
MIFEDAFAPVLPAEAAELASLVGGPVLLPGDEGYEDECRIYNLNVPLEPALVVGAAGADDVQAAVSFAARQGRAVAVKTTGHQQVTPARGGILISTRRMKGIAIDAAERRARVGAGVIWQEVIDEAAAFGLAPVSGSAPLVGVAGYTLGGGLSPVLGRSRGYAADHVRSLDVVTADAELRHVTADNDPELFWGLLGGKGNFGVVTALEFDLFPLTHFYGGGIWFPGERLADVLHTWRTWQSGMPEEMSSSVAVQRLPPLPELPEPLRGAFVVHVRIAHLGPAAEAERLIAPLRAAAPALIDTLGDMPYTAMGALHMDPPTPMPYFDRTTMLREFPAEAADKLVALLGPDSDSPLASVELRMLGGALDREPAVPNAVSTRGLSFVLFGFGVGAPDQAEFLTGALDEVMNAMEPWADRRGMVNFLSVEEATDPQRLSEVYGAERYRRLTAAKSTYDPTNMFRINHNIKASPSVAVTQEGGSGQEESRTGLKGIHADQVVEAFFDVAEGLVDAFPGAYIRHGAAGTRLLVSTLPLATMNGLSFDGHPDIAEAAELAGELAGLELPWSVQVRGEPSAAIIAFAAEHGRTNTLRLPLLALTDDITLPAPQLPEGAVVRRVSGADPRGYADALERGFDMPAEVAAAMAAPALLDGPGMSAYVVERDGATVATGYNVVAGDRVGLFNGAVPPEHRGNGYYRALVLTRLHDARAAGVRLAFTQNSPMSRPLYESLGFRHVETWTYLTT